MKDAEVKNDNKIYRDLKVHVPVVNVIYGKHETLLHCWIEI